MLKKMIAVASLGVIATVAALSNAGTSPAKDMPDDWFWHQDAAQAAKHAELIGKPAPALSVSKWFQGETSHDQLAGKIVILDIWATWCGPCKKAMPHTNEMARQYADQGVVFIGICSDGDEAFVPKFIAEKNLTFPMAWDNNAETAKAFRAEWFPTYVAIDRKGIVRAIGMSSDHVEDVVKKLLEEDSGA